MKSTTTRSLMALGLLAGLILLMTVPIWLFPERRVLPFQPALAETALGPHVQPVPLVIAQRAIGVALLVGEGRKHKSVCHFKTMSKLDWGICRYHAVKRYSVLGCTCRYITAVYESNFGSPTRTGTPAENIT